MKIDYWDLDKLSEYLIGKSVVSADDERLTLSDGIRLRFDTSNSDCCSGIDLSHLWPCENIITAVEVCDNETDGQGPYSAWIQVVTDAGIKRIAEAEGDASNGYYLHGFALSVTIEDAP